MSKRRRPYGDYHGKCNKEHTKRDFVKNRNRRSRRIQSSLILSSMLHQTSAIQFQSSSSTHHHHDYNRILQSGLSIGSSVNLDKCYTHLHTSDTNQDSILSPSEFLLYVQSSANGLLDTNEYGMPITQFYMLPQEFIGIYNFFACGNANYGCPSVSGIDISGVSEVVEGEEEEIMSSQQTTLMFQLCKLTQQAVDKLEVVTDEPTSSPTPIGSDEKSVEPTVASTTSFAPSTSSIDELVNATETPTVTLQPINQPTAVTSIPTSSSIANITQPPTESSNVTTSAPTLTITTTQSPITSPTILTNTPTRLPTLPECPPLYQQETSYTAGDMVSQLINAETNQYNYYQCKLFPMSGWCSQEGYEPTVGLNWSQAWNYVGACTLPDGTVITSSPTVQPGITETGVPSSSSSPKLPSSDSTMSPEAPTRMPSYIITLPPSDKPVLVPTITSKAPVSTPIIDVDDPPYSGPLLTTFQYEIFNTKRLSAYSITTGTSPDNDMMNVLETSTTEFVDSVVDETFRGSNSAKADGVDHSKDNENVRRRRLPTNERRLKVLLEPGSVSIKQVTDISCPGSSSTIAQNKEESATCQKVTVQSELTLIDEPKQATQLQFSSSVSRALYEPGITYPENSGIVYLGPDGSSVSVIPGVEIGDRAPPSTAPPEDGNGSTTPGWVIPVSIGAAAVGSILLVLLVGKQVQKRKRNGIQYQGYIAKAPNERDLRNDIVGSGSAEEVAVFVGSQTKVSPYNDLTPAFENVDDGIPEYRVKDGASNPFLSNSSSYSSSSKPSSPSSEYSNSSSGSSYTSGSSSNEDLTNAAALASTDEQIWEKAMQKHEQEVDSPKSTEAQQQAQWALSTLNESSERSDTDTDTDNFSKSNMSMSEASKGSQMSVYRAGVEALVKEVCPEKIDQIDEMMIEYEGREEILIGQLSSQLAAKNRESKSSTDTDDDANYTNLYTKKDKDDDDKSDASSSVGSSDWSSNDDGYSSFSGSLSTDQSDMDASMSSVPDISELDTTPLKTEGYLGSGKPMFSPVDSPGRDRSSPSDDELDSQMSQSEELGIAKREDLDAAIQAGDWKAVGATAALIANSSSPTKQSSSPSNKSDVDTSRGHSVSTHEARQVNELEELIEKGDWTGLMDAANRFENASDAGSLEDDSVRQSNSSLMETLIGSHETDEEHSTSETPSSSPGSKSSAELRAQIEDLVMTVVPSELENLDEMLLQFKGREDELISTLKTMKRKSTGHDDDDDDMSELGASNREGGPISVYESDASTLLPGTSSSKSSTASQNSQSIADSSEASRYQS